MNYLGKSRATGTDVVNSANFKRVYLLFILLGATAGCDVERGKDVEEVPPGIAFEGLSFRSYRGPTLAATGEAARASYRRDTGAVVAEELAIRLPGGPGEPDLLLRAPRGRGGLQERRFLVDGGITATRGGDVARTARASYDGAEVKGDEPVTIRGADWDLDGPGFTLDATSGAVRMGRGTLVVRRGLR